MTNDELFELEEDCLKAIRTVRRAVLMRLIVTALLIWAVAVNPAPLWTSGLLALVMLMNVLGALPLVSEWKKQRRRYRDLIDQEE